MRKAAYLHIPFCRRRCYYCDFPISVVGDRARGETSQSMADYVNWLCTEIKATPKDAAPLQTVFFGGGTPSLLSAEQVETILRCLDQQIGISAQAEISMEMDPGTFSKTQLVSLLSAGLNRISLGVQAFQDELLERCGRTHRRADIIESIELLKSLDVTNFSVDLISGLPGQSIDDWDASLRQAIEVEPHHLSCYDMVLEPVTVFGKQELKGTLDLPEESESAQMYRMASTTLRKAGYDHYEISNYARPGSRCEHNVTYWKNDDFYGFGMGAASLYQGRRVSRPRTKREYYDWVERLQQNPEDLFDETPRLSESDRLFETLMVGLRLTEGIDITTLLSPYGNEVSDQVRQAMQPYIDKNWVKFSLHSTEDSHLQMQLTDPEGLLYSNQVLVSLWDALDDLRLGV